MKLDATTVWRILYHVRMTTGEHYRVEIAIRSTAYRWTANMLHWDDKSLECDSYYLPHKVSQRERWDEQTIVPGEEGLVALDCVLYDRDSGVPYNVAEPVRGHCYMVLDRDGNVVMVTNDHSHYLDVVPGVIAAARSTREERSLDVETRARALCDLKDETPLDLVADWLDDHDHDVTARELRTELARQRAEREEATNAFLGVPTL